ncbi:hypothetical protein ACIA8O_22650 [Kitasatospora sp. NPDC051853]|uniref:hypothetical protein n=1 Tax=Kitasatospora sp. NPDC051853 TaxID=3364058 RepID=UPI0037A879DF
MSYEDELARALRGAADLAPRPEPAVLAAGAAARGRVLRRRRRAVRAGVCAAVVASALTTVALLPGSEPAPPAERPMVSAAFMELTVRALLPPGSVVEVLGSTGGRPDPHANGPMVELMLDDGHGPVRFSVSTERMALPVDADTPGAECPATRQAEQCVRTEGADGTIVLVQRAVERAEQGGRKTLVVQTTNREGRRVRLDLAGQDPESSLTVDRLTEIATSPAWDPVFVGLAVPDRPKEDNLGMPADRIASTVRALLPAGVDGKAPEGRFANGEQWLALTGNGREARLTVSVHLRSPIRPEAFGRGEEGLTRTADGASVLTRELRDDSDAKAPVTIRTVDVLHPDGTRVILSQSGPGVWPDLPPLEGREVLSLQQLVALAASPAWRG